MEKDDWLQLLDEFEAQIPLFVRTFVGELQARALYDVVAVPEDDILRTADETMRMLLARLRGNDTDLSSFASALGQRRARQGIPLDRLIDAIRLDLRIIWQMLLRLASPSRVPVLVEHVEQLMTLLDRYIDEVQHSFLAEIAILQRDSRLATEQHLSKLFNATSLTPTLLHEIAQGIDLSPEAELELILFKPQSAQKQPPREVQHWFAKRHVFGYIYRGWLLLFRELSSGISSWPKDFAELPSIYVHQVSGLAAVAAAARAAVELQASAPEVTRLTDLETFWASGTEQYLESLVPGYFRAILDHLEELPEGEQGRIIQTVRSFLGSGSIKMTADVMNCHRNTVVNRLRTFQELTGLDVSIPTESALAVVLLAGSHANSRLHYANA